MKPPKNFDMKITKMILAAMLAIGSYAASAQNTDDDDLLEFEKEAANNDNGFHFSTEFATRDVWRGGFVSSAAFEPELSYSIGGLSIGTWAACPLNSSNDHYNELDFYIEYAFDFGMSLMLTDYCWNNANDKFEYFGKYKDNHLLEATLGYDLGAVCDNVPLSFNANTIVAGANRKENDDQAFSTYMELVYAPSLKNIDLSLTFGVAAEPEDAAMYSMKGGFNIVNIDLGLSHDFKIKNVATLTVKTDLICNPSGLNDDRGDAYAIGGIVISF